MRYVTAHFENCVLWPFMFPTFRKFSHFTMINSNQAWISGLEGQTRVMTIGVTHKLGSKRKVLTPLICHWYPAEKLMFAVRFFALTLQKSKNNCLKFCHIFQTSSQFILLTWKIVWFMYWCNCRKMYQSGKNLLAIY